MTFCSQCGNEILPDQRFCSQCGATVHLADSAAMKIPSPADAELRPEPFAPTRAGAPRPSALFDPAREYYFLREKYWDWGSGPIYDRAGNEIGHMHRRILSIRKLIEFKEADNQTIAATINQKIVTIRPTYDIKDATDNLRGRVKKKLTSVFRPSLWLEDHRGKKILKAQGNFMGFHFTIQDQKGNLVAEVEKADKWRDFFLNGIFDYGDSYGIHIKDPQVDRLLIVGLTIAIDNICHDQ
ncbi:MAG: LURP-one-related family protein [Candidatus Heimdallarchaeota archaeon]